MPHIHLETTANLSENNLVPEILDALVAKFSTFDTITSQSVKGYATRRTQWAMGAGGAKGFVHCTISILAGRPVALRKAMAWAIQAILKDKFSESLGNGEASLTVEIREMDPNTYLK